MNNKIKINVFFYFFLFFSICAFLTDVVEYFFHINYFYELIIGLLGSILILFISRKKVMIETFFEKEDLIFFAFLFCIFIITILLPDKMYDTMNYHIFNQIDPFADKINYNFFPNTYIQSFNYGFGDRIFYIFRYIFGYRLGIILNYLLIVCLYYSCKNIFKRFLKINSNIANIFTIFIVLPLSVVDLIDCYYIDLMSLMLLVEILKTVIYDNDLKEENNIIISYIAILCGITFAIKISNLFFIIVFGIYYLLKNNKMIKFIKLKDIICFIIIFTLPWILYFINSFIQTGNPFFPFYNNIFKSKYFLNSNWSDTRFGPTNVIEVLIWPLYIIKYPNRTIDISIVEFMWAIGYVISLLIILLNIIKIIKKREFDKPIFALSVINVFLNLIWAKFMIGYIRYALIILIIDGIISFYWLFKSYNERKILATILIIIPLILNYSDSYHKYISSASSASYNNINSVGREIYYKNFDKLFSKDYVKINFKKNSVWGNVSCNSTYMKLLNADIPMIYLPYTLNEYIPDIENKKQELLSKAEKIYTASSSDDILNLLNKLNATNYSIKSVYDIVKSSFLNYNEYIYIFELEKSDNFNSNVLKVANEINYEFKNQDEYITFMYKIVNLDLNNKYKLNIYLDNYLIKTINLNASNLWYTNFDEKFTDVKNKKLNIKVVDNDEKNIR